MSSNTAAVMGTKPIHQLFDTMLQLGDGVGANVTFSKIFDIPEKNTRLPGWKLSQKHRAMCFSINSHHAIGIHQFRFAELMRHLQSRSIEHDPSCCQRGDRLNRNWAKIAVAGFNGQACGLGLQPVLQIAATHAVVREPLKNSLKSIQIQD